MFRVEVRILSPGVDEIQTTELPTLERLMIMLPVLRSFNWFRVVRLIDNVTLISKG